MMNNEAIVSSIKQLCKDNNITVTQLEKEVGMSQGLVSKWKDKVPSLDKIIDIADYFHVTLDEVVGRNKKLVDENYEFINLIIEQTKSGQLQWDDYPSNNENCKIPEEYNFVIPNFGKYPDHQRRKEMFFTKTINGYFMLSCWLILENNLIDQYEFCFYIQPNNEKEGIIQKCNQEQLLMLFKIIDATINGASPEMIADNFKTIYMQEHFINNYQTSLNKINNTKTYIEALESDPNIPSHLAQLDSPEIAQLIRIYTDPKMIEALENTSRIIQLLNQIKGIQKLNNSSKAKTFNEILEDNNNN